MENIKNLKAYYVVAKDGKNIFGPYPTRQEARLDKEFGEKIIQLAPIKEVR